MALVTVQRTPSGVNSPQSSTSESGGQEEEESAKTGIRSLSECYFAGKGTVLMLGSNERLVRSCTTTNNTDSSRSISNMSQTSDNISTTIRSPISTEAGCGSGSDIQKHLQSMFYLLRPEETLKMAVKLESMRAGRTRYLVVVSRPVKRKLPQNQYSMSSSLPSSASSSSSSSATSTASQQINLVASMSQSQASKLLQQSQQQVVATSTSNNQRNHQHHQSSSQIVTGKCTCSNTIRDNTTNFISPKASVYSGQNTTILSTNYDSNCDNNKNLTEDETPPIMMPPSTLPLNINFTSLTTSEPAITTTTIPSEFSSCTSCNKNNNLPAEFISSAFLEEDGEESCLLGIDCNERTTVGLVLKILADTSIRLDGDGGFSVSVCGRTHIFKPVSVQAMWSALQTLHKVSSKAREQNFFAGGSSHNWVSYYEAHIGSDRSCLNEWHTMDSIESRRPPSPDSIRHKPTEREETERVIRSALKEIIMSVDLDEVTSKYIRGRLETQLDMDFSEYKSFIDQEMLVILGQMDAPTEIFDHVYLGSEWNASNLEELQKNGVGHILNVTREIDNFFPGVFDYFNVRVYDDDKTDLLRHWDNTYRYITQAKDKHSKVLVHCKMGISRSASVVIAYAMKAYNWDFDQALKHVKDKRNCIKPNRNFIAQLETYQGMLDAMKNKEKLQRSKSETNLKSTKDARLLPGSEPTPLIQALIGAKGMRRDNSRKFEKKVMKRPRSWSPEMRKATCSRMIKPHSISLEHLADPTRSISCSVHNWNKTVLMPCDNGQNYSVSQNHIVHLVAQQQGPEQEAIEESPPVSPSMSKPVPSVKLIVSELELNDRKAKEIKRTSSIKSNEAQAVKENLDPSEVKSDDATGKPPSPMWSSSAHVIQTKSNIESSHIKSPTAPTVAIHAPRKENDLYSKQVDHVFDREERKHSNRFSNIPTIPPNVLAELSAADVSRNNSWSSVDSAVVMAETPREFPSRHSSWGSGDNRNAPSRNSSWGSYDMRNANITNVDPNQSVTINRSQEEVLTASGPIPIKEDVPWISGTVKRTKQKIEEQSVVKRICSDAKDPNAMQRQQAAHLQQKRNKSHNRCSSEEVLSGTNLSSNVYSRLSASAPETVQQYLSTSPAFRVLKQCTSVDETAELPQKKTDSSSSTNVARKAAGMVRNLKMNFEAKVQMPESTSTGKKKGRSLPSSPVHVDSNQNKSPLRESTKQEESTLEDINVRDLVGRYEENKVRNSLYRNSFPCTKRSTSIEVPSKYSQRRPASVLETTRLNINATNKPLMISHSTIFVRSDDLKPRPPVMPQPHAPHALKTVSVLNKTNNNNNNNNNSTGVCRKFQQHGKTHPLARIDITKQKLNTTTPYNTM